MTEQLLKSFEGIKVSSPMNGHFDFSDFCQFVDSIYSRIQIRIEKLAARIQQHSDIAIKLTHVKNLAVDFILA